MGTACESDLKILTVLKAQLPVRMTEVRWKIIAVSIILIAQFVPMECLNITAAEAEVDCVNSSSSDFPDDLFSISQRQNGAIVLHFILALYCFTVIAIVCNDYFLPAVDCICTDLNLSEDVAGATFMAVATSSPELFINIVGTFVTESDIGVGTIVGSAVFNILGVAACLGLAASKIILLEWWPLLRGCGIYVVTVGVLLAVTFDGRVEWYEALILVLMYIAYFIIMWQNGAITNLVKKLVAKVIGNKTILDEPDTSSSSEICSSAGPGKYRGYFNGDFTESNKVTSDDTVNSPERKHKSRLTCPPTGGPLKKVWAVFSWPVALLIFISIPDCRKDHFRRFYPLTFIMCIAWIGAASYINAWMMTVIGSTFGIPDSVMGLTLLAAGGCLPEAFSSIILALKGEGAMAISCSIGANTLAILLCLGMPWFIRGIVQLIHTGDASISAVNIMSDGITYSCVALLLCVLLLLVTLVIFRFQLGKCQGFTCLTMYIIFITFCVLIEMNVFFMVNRPFCDKP